MTDWQPIETAPRDGTWVLLTGGYDYEDEYPPAVVGAFVEVCNEEYWQYAYWDGAWRSGYYEPTHWAPIPAVAGS